MAAEVRRVFEVRHSDLQFLTLNRSVLDYFIMNEEADRAAVADLEANLKVVLRQFSSGSRRIFRQIHNLDRHGQVLFSFAGEPSATDGDPFFDLTSYKHRDGLFWANEYAPASGSVLRLGKWVSEAEGEPLGLIFVDLAVECLLQEAGIDRFMGKRG